MAMIIQKMNLTLGTKLTVAHTIPAATYPMMTSTMTSRSIGLMHEIV